MSKKDETAITIINKISTINDFEVVDSGSIILFDDQVTFNLEEGMVIVIKISKSETKVPKFEFNMISDESLVLNLYNVDRKDGTGPVKMLKLGTIREKELYFNFVVTRAQDDAPRIFYYSWYLK